MKRSKAVETAPVNHHEKFRILSVLFCCAWLFCLGSAFGVVYSTFEARKSIQELEALRREESGLRVASGQYQLEKSSLASYPRVESIARAELKMKLPHSGDTVLVVRE